MRYHKKTDCYYNSTKSLRHDPASGASYSYNWYLLTKVLNNGILLVNDFSYSVTTMKHLNIMLRHYNYPENSIYIEAPQGLDKLEASIKLYEDRIKSATDYMIKPRVKKSKQLDIIKHCEEKIRVIKYIQAAKLM
jgi:hypothetical protein